MFTYEQIMAFIVNSGVSANKQNIMISKLNGLSSPGSLLSEDKLVLIFEGMPDLLEEVKSQ